MSDDDYTDFGESCLGELPQQLRCEADSHNEGSMLDLMLRCAADEIARLREELQTQIEWGDAYFKSSEEARDAACWLYTALCEASCEAEVRAAYKEAERRWGTWLVSGE